MRFTSREQGQATYTIIFPALTLFFLVGALFSPLQAASGKEKKLWDAMTYLKSVPEIAWVEIERDHIILGWNGYPSQFSRINRTAAKKASKRVRGEVLVYSVKEEFRGWRPDKSEEAHFCRSVAKSGRLTFSNCR